MDLTQFNTYSTAARFEIVWEHGTFLAYRGRRGYRIELFDLGNFLAEVWFNPQTNVTALVRGYQSKKALELYVGKINLEMLS
ncbi:hypothetical protein H8S95_00675 [Pontibacter sp. KCTC 32443]|uniref:hypothetical protein n=1 Tax=Pontibacter TaxID=323449 RepID=UPI00164DFD7F|nr:MULTISPECIES: hypothetical protein [Pontibacter]MBC5772563.1 hypothetical protein [Pontibacter sp. KCTC 32443]